MSTAPAPGPRDSKPVRQSSQDRPSERPQPAPKPALHFDDPFDQQSADDTDQGWGERAPGAGSAADLARFLDEKPPHHI
ncbi:hypothetical protein [uncultured Streptomyces sp.]|uniref:hypothetical protein n=1 Tax=uncultured Streptomyces sp. TaxID=174707 RepID=UPI0026218142|nr:hypothetical protein [uncultured Streptomyces sp.]